jgi:hypothetical protein
MNRYWLRHPVKVISAIAADPVEAWNLFLDNRAAKRELPVVPYQADPEWEYKLYSLFLSKYPNAEMREFWDLWGQVLCELQVKGVKIGPESYKGWNDGDAGLVRAIWFLVKQLQPIHVVETGVANGITSRFILEALQRDTDSPDQFGDLWSIDRPNLDDENQQIGVAVGGWKWNQKRWHLLKGSSRKYLPIILSSLGQIDIFIHDSDHRERNVRFEVELAWEYLRIGGIMIIDDIDVNNVFHSFAAGKKHLICEAEPIRPDLRRFNKKGLFGIIFKEN